MNKNMILIEETLKDETVGYIPDSTRAYLKTICNHPLLTAQEEQMLGQRMKEGDKTAREVLITSNLRLVVSIAKKYISKTKIPFLDLIQEGNIGLVTAVDKWDYSLGYRFSTYATWWIKQAISKIVVEQSRLIRVPVHIIEQLSKLNKTTTELFQELNREPTTLEIAKRMDIEEKKVKELRAIIKDPISIDQTLNDEEDTTIGDLVADDSIEDPIENMYHAEMSNSITKVLQTLDKREAEILSLRYGLGGTKACTLEEIGMTYGLTKERIRQIENKALTKLRHPMRANLLKEYLEV